MEHVSRPRSTELADRDELVLEMAAQGYTHRKIASTLGISPARVSQILKAARETIDADAMRAKVVEMVEMQMEDTIKLIRGPGKRVVAASGVPVYELGDITDARGRHMPDLSKPLFDDFARLEAHKQLTDQIRTLSKILGLELKPREKDDTEAMGEVARYIEFLEKQVREQASRLDELQPVEGEIVS